MVRHPPPPKKPRKAKSRRVVLIRDGRFVGPAGMAAAAKERRGECR